jgi:PAS domain S-box-containing protein
MEERFRAEEEFREVLEGAPDAFVIVNDKGRIVFVNAQAQQMFGYSRDELQGRLVEELMPSQYQQKHVEHRAAYGTHPGVRSMGAGLELYGRRKDGAEFPVEISLAPLHTASGVLVASSIRDVTERKKTDALIIRSLMEKEVLLKEIHHRVKNNLTVISSLFYLQSTRTRDTQLLSILQDCRSRVRSIALVHEALYRSGNLAEVDFAEYARELLIQLLTTYGLTDNEIHVRTEMENIKMAMDTAVPCGLILNEMVSNAIKHAFSERQHGEIILSLRKEGGRSFVLKVRDSGVGLPEDLHVKAEDSLGLRLIQSLARQIDGHFELVPMNPGTEARLTVEAPQ